MNTTSSNNLILPKYLILVKKKGSKNLLCAHGWVGQTQHLFSWRRISQSEIRNSAAAEKSESESEGGQKFLPPQPPSFLPARAFSFCRAKRGNQSGFCSKKVRASFSNCDQSRHFKFSGEKVCSLAPPSAGLRSLFSLYFGIKSKGRTNSNSVFRESKRRFGARSTQQNKCFVSNFFHSARGGTQSKFFLPDGRQVIPRFWSKATL